MKHKYRKWLFLALTLNTNGTIAQNYNSAAPSVTADQVALIIPRRGITILSIDGDESVNRAFGSASEFSVSPGRHVIRVKYGSVAGGSPIMIIEQSSAPRDVELNAIAGGRYVINHATTGHTWAPYITNATNRPDLWCSTPGKCK